jgi:hypothetical protein
MVTWYQVVAWYQGTSIERSAKSGQIRVVSAQTWVSEGSEGHVSSFPVPCCFNLLSGRHRFGAIYGRQKMVKMVILSA